MRSLPASEVPAVVACGTDPIGAVVVRCLAEAGHPVSFGASSAADEHAGLEVELAAEGLSVAAFPLDVLDTESSSRFVESCVGRFGPPLCVVVNSSLAAQAPSQEWDTVIESNLSGAFRLVQRFLPGMIDKGYGRVVFVGSVASLVGRAGRAAYGALAAGLEGLVRSLAVEVAPHDVIVNAVAPGYIDDASAGLADVHERKQFVSSTALRRAGTVNEVAEVVRFLCGPDVSAVTGSVLRVDGGLTA